MTDQNEAMATALELLQLNQDGIAAALEELAKWVGKRGSTDIEQSALAALQVLSVNAEGIASAIRGIRQELVSTNDR
ncbi:hypothetical protein [Pseudomonas kilonensis]|uniref:hypothetical protein n=1 Tax=Pseudomonas TaxID=286 RepID=UPI00069CE0E8|nr:hypothetical protein [Pseudomonas kilonensis]